MSLENSYHNFDTLILNDWLKASKGDLTRLRIINPDLTMLQNEVLDSEAWENISIEHGETFGADKKHVQYLRIVKKLTILKLDLIIKEDPFIQNLIDIAQEELDELLKQIGTGKDNVSDTLIALSERSGVMLTEFNVTAKRFFEMINYYSKKD